MKKRITFLNALLSVVILFAILFQSVHSFEHLVKQFSEKKCKHQHRFATEITHQHKSFDQCFVCEFAFSSYISNEIQSFSFLNELDFYKNDSYFLKESNIYFSGISYSLRGPPEI